MSDNKDGEYVYRNGKVVGKIAMNRFCKFGVIENKHLLWSKGGVPCIDADSWDSVKDRVDEIYIVTNFRRFRVPSNTFERYKKTIDFGYGRQYYIDKELWSISPFANPKTPQKAKKVEEIRVDKQSRILFGRRY